MPTGRIVAFRIYHGDQAIVEGKFFVSAEAGVSTFGEYRAVEVSAGVTAPIFEGVVINHSLARDGSVSMELDLYGIDAAGGTPKQHRVLRAGLSMGCEAGERRSESVMLGNTHEFVYQTQMVG